MYTVYYKKVNGLFFKKLKKVKGDGFVPNTNERGEIVGPSYNTRWFVLEDDSRVELSCDSLIIKFSKERHFMIRSQVERESGAKV